MLRTGFSGSRLGGLVFPSLEGFSTVCCDPHKGFGVVSKAEVDVFLELLCFFDDLTDVHSRLLSCQDENGIFLVAFFLTTYALYFHFLFLV